ncbi:MAG: peptide deformylase [Thermoplasmatota archaeon]
MTIKEVLMIGNPKLREKCTDIKNFDSELDRIIDDLKDTLTYLQNKNNIGRALAAPQIGYQKNVVFMQIPQRTIKMVNPKIVWKSDETFDVWDSCFSFDVAFFVNIKRHERIEVEYQDDKDNSKLEEFEGDLSELFQHEIDHLNGILATDHLEDNKNIIMRSEWERRYLDE